MISLNAIPTTNNPHPAIIAFPVGAGSGRDWRSSHRRGDAPPTTPTTNNQQSTPRHNCFSCGSGLRPRLAVKPSARGRTSYNTNNQQPTTIQPTTNNDPTIQPTTISVLEFPET